VDLVASVVMAVRVGMAGMEEMMGAHEAQ
jgi:hypothetical protein